MSSGSRCTAGRRHDGAKLPRCASSSTANANRLWWPECNQPPCLCCRWVQDRHDHSCLIMHRSTALRLDAMCRSHHTDRSFLARAAGCRRSLAALAGSIGREQLGSREAVEIACRAAFDGWLHGRDGVWHGAPSVTALLLLSMLLTCDAVLLVLHSEAGDGRRERLSSCGGLRKVLHLSGVSCCNMMYSAVSKHPRLREIARDMPRTDRKWRVYHVC